MSGENPEIYPKSIERIRLGNFVFSLGTKELKDNAGNVVHLRRQSSDVLACLVGRRGTLVSKSELIENVWPDTFVTDDSLGQCISDIRRALNDTGHHLVQTFPKKGYMLVAGQGPDAKREGDASQPDDYSSPSRPVRRSVMLAGVVLLVAAALWLYSWTAGDSGREVAVLAVPDEPSIIVLPFSNQSAQDDLDYLAAGLSTSIRTQLAKFPQFLVIAGATAMTFKDGPGTARGIGRELGVRYVLGGSLRTIGDGFTLATELVETETERSVWAQEYEFQPDETVNVQSGLVQEIVSTLNVVIGDEELSAVLQRPTENPKAYELFMRAEAATRRLSAAGRAEAVDLLNAAIALDPGYLAAHYELSGRYLGMWRFGGADDPDEALRLARHHAERALEISRSDYRGHFRMGMLHLFADHKHDLAHAAFLRALKDNPNDADILYNMGFLRALMGQPEEAIEWNDKAKRINPRYPGWYNFNAAQSRFFIGDFDGAETLAGRASPNTPSHSPHGAS